MDLMVSVYLYGGMAYFMLVTVGIAVAGGPTDLAYASGYIIMTSILWPLSVVCVVIDSIKIFKEGNH